MASGMPKKRYGRHLGSLAELGLSDEQLAVMAVREAVEDVLALESFGLEPTEALRRRAAGDPDLVAAFVSEHSAHRPAEAT